jgi:hypothetical protein
VLRDGCTSKNCLTAIAWGIRCQKLSQGTDLFWRVEHEINLDKQWYKMSFLQNSISKAVMESNKTSKWSAQRKGASVHQSQNSVGNESRNSKTVP